MRREPSSERAAAGDLKTSRAVLERHEAEGHPPALALKMRIAAWYGELDEVRALVPMMEESSLPLARFSALYARLLLGDLSKEAGEAKFETMSPTAASPRFVALAMEAGAEIFAAVGDLERAEAYLKRAMDGGLVDLEWLDRCPLLGIVRGRPLFLEARRLGRQRAEAFWSAVHQ